MEGNVLFNDVQHIFLWFYGVKNMVKDHSDNERKSTSAISWATLPDQQVNLYMYHPTDRIIHTMALVTGCNEKY